MCIEFIWAKLLFWVFQTPQLQTATYDLNEDSKEDTDACGEYSSPIGQSLPPLPLYTPRESIAEATTTVTDLLQPDLWLVICNNGSVPYVIDGFDSVKKFLQKYGTISTCWFPATTEEHNQTAGFKRLAEYPGSKIDEMKAKLTSQFRKFINSISAQESKANDYHRVIGGKLIRLLDESRKNPKPKAEQFAENQWKSFS